MSDKLPIETSEDSVLVAYLDGELAEAERSAIETRLGADANLKARLEYMARGGRPFGECFDVLLREAPSGHLAKILESALATKPKRVVGDQRLHDHRLAQIAAAFVLFLAGGALGVSLPRLLPEIQHVADTERTSGGWRAVVAEYLTLYTNDTLANIPDDAAVRARELEAVGSKLALDLSFEKVVLPQLSLKRSQLFNLDGKPLAQIAYLSPRDGPVAFCIIADGATDEAIRFEQRGGENILFWSKAGHAFMLIGQMPRSGLEPLAASLAKRVI